VDIARVGTVVTYHKHLSSACLDENSPLGLALIGTLICNSCFPRNMQIIQFFSTDGFNSEKQISLVTLPDGFSRRGVSPSRFKEFIETTAIGFPIAQK
jgi:hypothetical protein